MGDIYQALKQDILTCQYEPGRLLQEAEIAERFGTSKTPAREALGRLCQEGLIESIPYKGYLITPPTIRDWQELLEVRTILEAAAAETAARRIQPWELERLQQLAALSYSIVSRESIIQYNQANKDFHVAVAEATKNRRLATMVGDILDRSQRLLFDDLHDLDPASMSREHTELVAALQQGDAPRARELMLAHLEGTKARSLRDNLLS